MIQTHVISKPPNFPKSFDLSKELNIAARVVVKNIQKRMKDNKDIEGKPLRELAPATIAQKSKSKNAATRKNAENPMRATGNLLKNQKIKNATKSSQVAEISIGPTREEIYGYHHEGAGNLPIRQTFGMGPEDGPEIDKLMILRIERILATI